MQKSYHYVFIIALFPFLFYGCPAIIGAAAVYTTIDQKKTADLKSDTEVLIYRQKITQQFSSNPDTDSWHEHRQKISLALGERIFEQDFARVFDSLVLSIASLELRVDNMERTSGYVSASGIALPPSQSNLVRQEMVSEWLKINNIDPELFNRPLNSIEMTQRASLVDIEGMVSRYNKANRGLTFQLISTGEHKTKVKLRFFEVYYPSELETYYQIVWQAVDKQIFVDHTIEGSVDNRPESTPKKSGKKKQR